MYGATPRYYLSRSTEHAGLALQLGREVVTRPVMWKSLSLSYLRSQASRQWGIVPGVFEGSTSKYRIRFGHLCCHTGFWTRAFHSVCNRLFATTVIVSSHRQMLPQLSSERVRLLSIRILVSFSRYLKSLFCTIEDGLYILDQAVLVVLQLRV